MFSRCLKKKKKKKKTSPVLRLAAVPEDRHLGVLIRHRGPEAAVEAPGQSHGPAAAAQRQRREPGVASSNARPALGHFWGAPEITQVGEWSWKMMFLSKRHVPLVDSMFVDMRAAYPTQKQKRRKTGVEGEGAFRPAKKNARKAAGPIEGGQRKSENENCETRWRDLGAQFGGLNGEDMRTCMCGPLVHPADKKLVSNLCRK